MCAGSAASESGFRLCLDAPFAALLYTSKVGFRQDKQEHFRQGSTRTSSHVQQLHVVVNSKQITVRNCHDRTSEAALLFAGPLVAALNADVCMILVSVGRLCGWHCAVVDIAVQQ